MNIINNLEFFNKKYPRITLNINAKKDIILWGEYPMLSKYYIIKKNVLNKDMAVFLIENKELSIQFKLKYSKKQLFIIDSKGNMLENSEYTLKEDTYKVSNFNFIEEDVIYHYKLTKLSRISFNKTKKKLCIWKESLEEADWESCLLCSSIGKCPNYKFPSGMLCFNPKNNDHGTKWNGSLIQLIDINDL